VDRNLTSQQLLKRKFRNTFKIILFAAIVIFGFWGIIQKIKPVVKHSKILIAVAELGRVEDALSATGTIVPEYEQVISSPIQSTIIAAHFQSGMKVAAGAAILKLNKEFVQLELDRLNDELKLQRNRKIQLTLSLERNRTELQAQYDIKQLTLDLLRSKLSQAEHLYEIGAGSKDHLDQARLNLEIAKRELYLLEQTIANEEKSLNADLREIDLKIGIQEKSIMEVVRQLELADIKADRDGVITWLNDNIGSTVQPGEIVVRIADLSSYKVEGSISDIHASRFRVGTLARIRVNDRDLDGIVTGIQPTIRSGVITFFVELSDKSNSVLRSNLRVDVFVITSYKDNIVRVQNGPFINGPGEQMIFVVEGNQAIRKTVRIGASNLDYVEIENEIHVGDEIIISDMNKFKHMSTVTIKD